MARLTLLFITRSYENNILKEFNYLIDELAKQTNIILWNEPGNIQNILQSLHHSPDLIILHEHGARGPAILGLSSVSIPTVAFLHDLHHKIQDIKNAVQDDKIGYILTIARDTFYEWYPEFIPIMYWFPHHVNPRIFDDFGLEREIDYLLMGSIRQKIYPLRHKIVKTLKGTNHFTYHPHFGYSIDQIKDPIHLGLDYAYEINRAKIFFTCDSIYHYPVQKYFEVLACKTLLLAPSSQELLDLGFIPGVHYVEINEENFMQQAEFYLRNEKERLKIAERGYRMVHANHTTPIRAAQFVRILQEILSELYG